MNAMQLLDEHLPKVLEQSAAQAQQVGAVFLLELTGSGGGRWTLDLKSSPPTVKSGEGSTPDASLKLTVEDFEAIMADGSKAFELFFQGKLQVTGDPALAARLPALMGLLQAPH